ncbi:DUF6766 family protein [Nonomuraea sp. WAC 01424]|uniref:DUF6766 family protein n=1 Tax=Nonomuraea sp. WAC 01424 TaxID=2203200 RepID=UPI0021ADCDAD|nr:DUF6766 family protein [Nonomuraea sp. WAC 01424]
MRLPFVVPALLLAAVGCAADPTPAARAAERFHAALESRHEDAACALLSRKTARKLPDPGQTCGQALSDLHMGPGGRVTEVNVWGNEAQVRLTGDTLFLHHFDDGWRVRKWLKENPLSPAFLVMFLLAVGGQAAGAVFVLSWLAQSVAGQAAYNAVRLGDLRDPVSWGQYVTSAEFWNRSLQNWQSELLAVLSMVVLSIYLRQRGSPESKPVGAPHAATNVEG